MRQTAISSRVLLRAHVKVTLKCLRKFWRRRAFHMISYSADEVAHTFGYVDTQTEQVHITAFVEGSQPASQSVKPIKRWRIKR